MSPRPMFSPDAAAAAVTEQYMQIAAAVREGGGAAAVSAAAAPDGRAAPDAADDARLLYSVEANPLVQQLHQRYVLQGTHVKELEKEVQVVRRELVDATERLEDALERQDDAEAALARLRSHVWKQRHRPDVVDVVGDPMAEWFPSPATGVEDCGGVARALLALPPFAPFPSSICWLLAHHCKLVHLAPGATVGSVPRLRRSYCVVLRGRLACTGGVAVAAGGALGEHNLLGRSPAVGRDLEEWAAAGTGAIIAALPARLYRRLVLSEHLLLNTWSDAALHHIVSPGYSPVHVSARFALRPCGALTALTNHVMRYKCVALRAALASDRPSVLAGEVSDDDALAAAAAAAAATEEPPANHSSRDRLLMRLLSCVGTAAVAPEALLHTAITAITDHFRATGGYLFEVDVRRDRAVVRVGPLSAMPSSRADAFPRPTLPSALTAVVPAVKQLAGAPPLPSPPAHLHLPAR